MILKYDKPLVTAIYNLTIADLSDHNNHRASQPDRKKNTIWSRKEILIYLQ